jgi:predicted nuclease of predicted toxin-antitoxin system
VIKCYLDEDLSPVVAEMLRKEKIDAVSAHEAGMLQASDLDQMEYAASRKRCLVTRNRNDFIRITVQFFNEHRPHHGVLIIPHSYPGDRFRSITTALKTYAKAHKDGLSSYLVDFL